MQKSYAGQSTLTVPNASYTNNNLLAPPSNPANNNNSLDVIPELNTATTTTIPVPQATNLPLVNPNNKTPIIRDIVSPNYQSITDSSKRHQFEISFKEKTPHHPHTNNNSNTTNTNNNNVFY